MKLKPPNTSAQFDRAYQAPFTMWGDVRVPEQVKALARSDGARRVLELGCGVGRFSRYLEQQGMVVTGVDFSAVAIERARASVTQDARKPEFLVGDVTRLTNVTGPFEASFDVGCFHCLDANGQERYAAEVARLLVPGGMHVLWVLDGAPSDLPMVPEAIEARFSNGFALRKAKASRRRLVASHWYWLERKRP